MSWPCSPGFWSRPRHRPRPKVRLVEKHPDDVATVLAKYRAGDWAGARDHVTRVIGNRYDADWYGWLSSLS